MGARLPIVTWLCGTSGESVNVTVTISGSPEVKTIAIGSVYGWGVTDSLGTAATDTIARALRNAIMAHTGHGGSCAVAYNISTYTTGPASYRITPSFAVTVGFGSVATAKRFGFATSNVTFSANTATETPYSPSGMWSPNGAGGFVFVETRERAAASSSDMATAFTDTLSWGQISVVNLEAVQVPAAFLMGDFAANSIYATQAGRNVNDPNNTLELLLAEAAEQVAARVFRVWREAAATGYLVAKLPAIARQGRALDYASWTDKPRYAAVGMTFVGA